MTPVAATPVQVVRLLEHVRRKNPGVRRVGLRYAGTWTGPERVVVGGTEFRVVSCPSVLAMRETLAEAGDDEALLLLTDREEKDLGTDVLARLAKRKLQVVDPWLVLQDLFSAHSIDPRLTRLRWLAEALLASAPAEGYAAVPTGCLDPEAAWEAFARTVLGLASGRPDVRELLRWSVSSGGTGAYRTGGDELRSGLALRVQETAGQLGTAILANVDAGKSDPVAVGLVCRVLWHPDLLKESDRKAAVVRLEAFVRDVPVTSEMARLWADEAEALVREAWNRDGYPAVKGMLEQGELLLAAVKGEAGALVSDLLPSSFEARLRRLGTVLRDCVKDKGRPADVESAARKVTAHALAGLQVDRAEAAGMAARLVRWRATPEAAGNTPADEVVSYATDGSFADWARERLTVAEGTRELASAFRELHSATSERRERQNERFAKAVASWSGQSTPASGVLPIEKVLAEVVVPLAKEVPVLLLVLDGMSLPVFHELLSDARERHGWTELIPEKPGRRMVAVAGLPTLTEVSRTSLLCGTLRSGGSEDEKKGFASHAGLVRTCRPGKPPILFHKGEVGPGAFGTADEIEEKVGDPNWRVVGVVLNAVDDHLDKGDQIHPRWSLEYIRPLAALLDAADAAGRVIVLTADHGHVLDCGGEIRVLPGARERCRPATTPTGAGELLATGPRVVWEGKKVILPFTERLSYSPKRKNGYHGGVTPQEAVVPVSVLCSREQRIPDWVVSAGERPEWWTEEAVAAPAAAVAEKSSTTRALTTKSPAPQRDLFDGPTKAGERVLQDLVKSERFKEQLATVQRQAITAKVAADVARALEARGGTMTRAALAKELGMPEFRVKGYITTLKRVLNVEGYAVLAFDEASSTVTLNVELLRIQFEL